MTPYSTTLFDVDVDFDFSLMENAQFVMVGLRYVPFMKSPNVSEKL